ncbi:MAG: ABC transporter permease [Planctomycetes bacterium]|nr:ABC transporter permease [Planctomycetota bacterium]
MEATKENRTLAVCTVISHSPQEMRVELSGNLTASTLADIWKRSIVHPYRPKPQKLTIDGKNILSCDGAGVSFISYLIYEAQQNKVSVEVVGLRDDIQKLLNRFKQAKHDEPLSPAKPLTPIEVIGKLTLDLCHDIYEQVAFFARVLVTGLALLPTPWKFRWNDFFGAVENAGVRALGIVSLLGFLFGLIMSFSSAMPLRQFGVEVYVSDLVAYAMVRVLGPILTAIIVAGRTGSAYAAELGTMKINSEIDALEVMNFNPTAFLVLPRVLATTLMTPFLTIAAIVLGLVGSAIVILSLGYPVITYTSHIQSILTVPDVLVGLTKAVVYGAMIGTVGCLRGLQTKIGAGAVGLSTTRAVVTAIILLVLMEGLFSVLLYFMDI